jgi:hypothetical protein
MGRAPTLPVIRMADLLRFLRARLDELENAGWHDGDCIGIPGLPGSCCAARAFLARDVAAKRHRIIRYEEAVARQGQLDMALWWDGAMTALWAEVRSDAALWQRHADYRPEWKAPVTTGREPAARPTPAFSLPGLFGLADRQAG